VIIPDVNLLIYAIDADSAHHDKASRWWHDALSGREAVGLPWVGVLAFVRLTTNPRIFTRPLDASAAVGIVESWLGRPHISPVEPSHRHLGIVRGLLAESGAAGNLVTDAHLAALAIEHGAALYSADNDFARFRGLTWRNPLMT
jgi:toxin-antitoxin system PIN domain toxin